MEQQLSYFEKFSRAYLAVLEPADAQHVLLAQIATARLAMDQPLDVTASLATAQTHSPELLESVREIAAANVQRIRDEATDPDLALLHWQAARGLALSALLGLCPLSEEERNRLFDRLRAETQKASEAPSGST